MNGTLLATKLSAPARRLTSVHRARLTERLAHPRRLVLVAAPTGFGKTTILTDWLAQVEGYKLAWLSLDERDNDAAQFWTYLLAAVDQGEPGVTTAAAALLASASVPHEAILVTLVNDLHARGTHLILVLDDYHVIENPVIHTGMTFFIDNLPSHVHVVVASRADPPLSLGRLRAKGDLTELRAADLRFTPDETSEYLKDTMGLTLDATDAARLGARTEGWIAALQLAAISMQGRDDASQFIAGFAGDDRYIVDYLMEEVLLKQTDATRMFLLQTSILGRLCGDLCDAVTGGSRTAKTLDALDRTNLFLVPLDDRREWYRYHHLFAEMLRARLLDEQPNSVADLHFRASEWFEHHGDTGEAIGHAIDAGAFGRAAELIKKAAPRMQQERHEVTLVGWLGLLPDSTVAADAELAVIYAGALLSAGRTEGVDRLLTRAEASLGSSSQGIEGIRRGATLYRAAQALSTGDLATADAQSALAIERSLDGSNLDRGSAHGLRGLVLWAQGDLAAARATWAISLSELEKAGHLADVLGGSVAMGDILVAQGRLGDAEAIYRRALEIAATTDPPLRGAADMHVGLAGVLLERGDLEGARRHLSAAEALGEYAGLPQNRHRRRMATAELLSTEGDPATGIPLLNEAELFYTPDFFPPVRPIAAMRARLELAAGCKRNAVDWARTSRISASDVLSYMDEYDHITLVRVLLADPAEPRDLTSALDLLERLQEAANSGERWGVVIELLVLQSLALQHAGRTDDALAALRQAIAHAESEGYERRFIDEGQAMANLLSSLAKRDGDSAYLRRLRGAIGSRGAAPARSESDLIEPLSDRELEVLRLLASELSGPQIARHLVISVNTLRTHTKNIFLKLDVSSRREALKRADELGLLSSPQ